MLKFKKSKSLKRKFKKNTIKKNYKNRNKNGYNFKINKNSKKNKVK